MVDYTLISVTQGETLSQEFRLTDADGTPVALTGATLSVQPSSPLSPLNFAFVTGSGVGEMILTAYPAVTRLWPPGIHEVQLWLNWGAVAERIVSVRIAVQEALVGGGSLGDWRGNWATATLYLAGDRIFDVLSGSTYYAISQHTSGTFLTDLSTGKWGLVASGGASAAADDNYGSRSAFVTENNAIPGLGKADGYVVMVAGYGYRRLTSATAIPDLPGWVPNGKATPFHFGAVGNNVADDRPAFVSLNAYGGDAYLPRPPVAWNVSSAIDMNVVSVEIDPTLTWTQATDAGAINWGAATNDFFPDQDGVHIRRESNRLFVFQGADFTGNFGGSQQGFVPTLTEGANWAPRDAALFVAQDRGLLSVVGFSSNVNENRDDAIANCAVAGFVIGNKNTGVGGSSARTFYGDLQFEDGQFGFGIELALKNKTGVTIDCTPYTKNLKVTGFWVVPGGDASYGGAANADVCVAMAFGGGTGAGMKFNKGIVFWENSLRPDVNGRGQALSLGQSQELAWYSTGAGTFKITSSGQTTVSTELLSNNLGINVRGFTTETQTFGVGQSRTGDGRSQVHLYADGAGQQSMSLIAYAGANGIRDLRTRGTGALQIVAQDAAPVLLATNNTTRVTVETDGRVGIGAAPLVSSAFAVTSTTGGLLLPRMTTTQRDAIASVVDGLMIYNTTSGQFEGRRAGAWVTL